MLMTEIERLRDKVLRNLSNSLSRLGRSSSSTANLNKKGSRPSSRLQKRWLRGCLRASQISRSRSSLMKRHSYFIPLPSLGAKDRRVGLPLDLSWRKLAIRSESSSSTKKLREVVSSSRGAHLIMITPPQRSCGCQRSLTRTRISLRHPVTISDSGR